MAQARPYPSGQVGAAGSQATAAQGRSAVSDSANGPETPKILDNFPSRLLTTSSKQDRAQS